MSLLMWECGLKPIDTNQWARVTMSLLMWECGLKPVSSATLREIASSLLMWECGLKLWSYQLRMYHTRVTPYVGVWIETRATFC